ncbi:MAG: hypothetical protein KBS47_05730 [Bacteroidales bacterium]|nr:hypothetical protein [Candidatus Equimonas enterica]
MPTPRKTYQPVRHRRPVRGRGKFLVGFALAVVLLALLRYFVPGLGASIKQHFYHDDAAVVDAADTLRMAQQHTDSLLLTRRPPLALLDAQGRPVKHRVVSVPTFADAFPDLNDVQLASAKYSGIAQCADRDEALRSLDRLVYIGDCPYYAVKPLHHSIPYLVPRAATLLSEIGRNFLDSLAAKGIPFHKMMVTSVLRTQQDVERLRRHNGNASEQSCHQYGTTFDISYNNFVRVQDPDLPPQVETWAVTLKSVLAEVLNDQRRRGTCYVKYEYRQSCFHVTVR